jgi:hypothetical protein
MATIKARSISMVLRKNQIRKQVSFVREKRSKMKYGRMMNTERIKENHRIYNKEIAVRVLGL